MSPLRCLRGQCSLLLCVTLIVLLLAVDCLCQRSFVIVLCIFLHPSPPSSLLGIALVRRSAPRKCSRSWLAMQHLSFRNRTSSGHTVAMQTGDCRIWRQKIRVRIRVRIDCRIWMLELTLALCLLIAFNPALYGRRRMRRARSLRRHGGDSGIMKPLNEANPTPNSNPNWNHEAVERGPGRSAQPEPGCHPALSTGARQDNASHASTVIAVFMSEPLTTVVPTGQEEAMYLAEALWRNALWLQAILKSS